MKTMTFKQLYDQLTEIKNQYYNTDDVPIHIFITQDMGAGDRAALTLIDEFTDGHTGQEILTHIDLNATYSEPVRIHGNFGRI